MVDVSKIRAVGGWTLLKVHPPEEKTKGGLFIPQGNLEERLGHATADVLSIGKGYFDEKGRLVRPGFSEGDTIMFRGYMQELQRPGGFLDREHCFIRIEDIDLVLED
jgi:co-chaperonin GroES (HSP10)